MTQEHVTKITFSAAARPLVEKGTMRAVIVRGRTADEIAPMLELKTKQVAFGNGLVADVAAITVYGNGYARLGERMPLMTHDQLKDKLIEDLGIDKDGFAKEIRQPFSGVVVWFEYEPLPELA